MHRTVPSIRPASPATRKVGSPISPPPQNVPTSSETAAPGLKNAELRSKLTLAWRRNGELQTAMRKLIYAVDHIPDEAVKAAVVEARDVLRVKPKAV